MQIFYYFLLVGVLPIVLFFLLERFLLLYYMQKTPNRILFVQNSWFLKPNFICLIRYPMGLITVAILYFSQTNDYFLISEKTAFYFWTFWMITDISDGTIARRYQLVTKEGAAIDPLSDKLMQFPLILYLCYLGYASWLIASIYIFIDSLGQLSRNFKLRQKANIFGKAKTFLIVVLITLIYSQQIWFDKVFLNLANSLLIFSIFLSVASMLFRFIPNNYYGNLLSFINLLCGCVALFLIILDKENMIFAFFLVFIGQFLDLYDGRVVRKWGGTKRGELYDDIADAVTFGFAVGFIIFAAIENFTLALILMLLHIVFTIYRLYRFTVNKRKQNLGRRKTVNVFQGLPSPASASFVGSSIIVLEKYQTIFSDKTVLFLQAITALLADFLMVSKIPYLHFAKEILPKTHNSIKVISMVFILFWVLWDIESKDFANFFYFIFTGSILYLIFGINFYNKK